MSDPVRRPAYPRQDGLTAMSALQEDEDFLQSIWTGADGEIPIESSEDASSSYFFSTSLSFNFTSLCSFSYSFVPPEDGTSSLPTSSKAGPKAEEGSTSLKFADAVYAYTQRPPRRLAPVPPPVPRCNRSNHRVGPDDRPPTRAVHDQARHFERGDLVRVACTCAVQGRHGAYRHEASDAAGDGMAQIGGLALRHRRGRARCWQEAQGRVGRWRSGLRHKICAQFPAGPR